MRQAAAGLALVVAAAACSSPGAGRPSLTVVAAASLTEPFTEIARLFEAEHPATDVALAFAATPAVAHQVRAGAPADVVAAAERAVVDALAADGLAGPVVAFATNRMAVAVAPGNPLGIRTVDDLAAPGVDLVVCAPEVPCGRLADRALTGAARPARPRSYEPDVKAVLGRVARGEADAGLVYATDVRAAGDRAAGVPLGAAGLVAEYGAATVTASPAGERARAFVAFLGSPAGRRALAAAGFELP